MTLKRLLKARPLALAIVVGLIIAGVAVLHLRARTSPRPGTATARSVPPPSGPSHKGPAGFRDAPDRPRIPDTPGDPLSDATIQALGSQIQAAHGRQFWGKTLSLIAEQVRPLKGESPQLSLANLWEGKMFTYPAMYLLTGMGEIGPFPLQEETGSADIIRVTSNRRVVKLLEELGAMPKSEAARLVSEQVMATLEPYREDCDQYLELLADLPNLDLPYPSMSHPVTSVDDPPDAHWMRASLLSLVFIAGNLELADARDAVLTVAYEAVTQRDTFYDYENTGLRMDEAHYALTGIGLYNRSLLATGLIGVGAASDAAAATLEASGKDWIEMRLTPYDAEVSTYDQPVLRGDMPPDFSRGEILVRYLPPLNDEEFDAILFGN